MDNRLTILVPVTIRGRKGNLYEFKPYKQFCSSEKQYLTFEPYTNGTYTDGHQNSFIDGFGNFFISQPGVSDNRKYSFYYLVIINDEEFYIPEEYVGPCSKELSEEEQKTLSQKKQEEDRDRYFIADEKAYTKKVIGIDIVAGEKTDYNGEFLQKIIDNSSNCDC